MTVAKNESFEPVKTFPNTQGFRGETPLFDYNKNIGESGRKIHYKRRNAGRGIAREALGTDTSTVNKRQLAGVSTKHQFK